MNPAAYIMKRVNAEDTMVADKLFMLLMGDNPEPRKAFIRQSGKLVVVRDV